MLEAHVGTALAEAEANYRAARLWGTLFLGLGLALSTSAAFAT